MNHKLIAPTLLVSVLVFASTLPLLAQPCQRVEIATNTLRENIIREFISESRHDRYFIDYDKGIVRLITYRDGEGREHWTLSPHIDDVYRLNPPTKYAVTKGGDIILVYDADSMGRILKAPAAQVEALNQCLEEVIGDRVYIRPPRRPRKFMPSTEVIMPDGKVRQVDNRKRKLGNAGDIGVTFNKDGTITKGKLG